MSKDTAVMKLDWDAVEKELIEDVFYAHDDVKVRASKDLAADGMIDSLSVVAILEILIEASGAEDELEDAQAGDFRNLAAIRALYERV